MPARNTNRPRSRPLGVEALEERDVPALVVGLTPNNQLLQFDSSDPTTLLGAVAITGLLTATEHVTGIDLRPQTGVLYAVTVPLGATSNATMRLYTVDPFTGVATATVATSTLPGAADVPTAVDFNPITDQIRVVLSNNENGRVNPNTGALTSNDTDLVDTSSSAYTGRIVTAAYDRNFPHIFFPPTTLYAIDSSTGELVTIGDLGGFPQSANSGQVNVIGSLGLASLPADTAGLDITRSSANGGRGTALAALTVGGVASLYDIDLSTGTATSLGTIVDGSLSLIDLAVLPQSSGTVDLNTALVVGSGPGAQSDVRVLDPVTGAIRLALTPFAGFAGGVRVAAGDVNGDGVTDVIVSAVAPQGHIKVFDGATVAQLYSFFAYPGFTGTINVASGDVNGDGYADIVTVSNGAGGHVKAFSGLDGSELRSFLAYPGTNVNVTVGVGDLDGDGQAEIVTVASFQGHVKVFSGNGTLFVSPTLPTFQFSFFEFPGYFGDVNVVVGDLNGDNRAEVVFGTGQGTRGHVKVFSGVFGTEIASFYAYPPQTFNGAFVAIADATGDRRQEIRVTPGAGVPPFQTIPVPADVKSYDLFGNPVGSTFPAFAGYLGGATIAAG